MYDENLQADNYRKYREELEKLKKEMSKPKSRSGPRSSASRSGNRY